MISSSQSPVTSRTPVAANPARDDESLDAEIAALEAEEARLAALARARGAAQDGGLEKLELRVSVASAKAKSAREAKAILQELAKARAEERAAAEASVRRARAAAPSRPPVEEETETASAKTERSSWFPAFKLTKVWYFTSEGEARGPVTFADLKAMAANSVLDPRRDLVWKEGMTDWKLAGLVEGVFERSAVQMGSPAGSALPAPVALRSSALAAALSSREVRWPGSGRLMLLAGVLFTVLWRPMLAMVSPHFAAWFGDVLTAKLMPWAPYLPVLVWIQLLSSRLANLGMSRWWAPVVVVPVLNLWVAFRCVVCPAGYAYHKRMDGAGKALVTSAVLLVTSLCYAASKKPGGIYGERLRTGIESVIDGAGKLAQSRF